MNKAEFDRKYKAIKGHLLNEIVVQNYETGEVRAILNISWDEHMGENGAMVISFYNDQDVQI